MKEKQFTELYRILGVSPDATQDLIKKAYRTRSKETHPDTKSEESEKIASEKEFKKIAAAYAVLSNAEKRKRYDETGDTDDKKQRAFMNMLWTNFISEVVAPCVMNHRGLSSVNIMTEIHKQLKETVEKGNELTEEYQETIDKCDTFLARLKGGKTENDALRGYFEGMKRNNLQSIKKIHEEQEGLKQIKEILKEYSYDYDPSIPFKKETQPQHPLAFLEDILTKHR